MVNSGVELRSAGNALTVVRNLKLNPFKHHVSQHNIALKNTTHNVCSFVLLYSPMQSFTVKPPKALCSILCSVFLLTLGSATETQQNREMPEGCPLFYSVLPPSSRLSKLKHSRIEECSGLVHSG